MVISDIEMTPIIEIIIYNSWSMQQTEAKFHFNLGQNVDVRDTKNKWVNG